MSPAEPNQLDILVRYSRHQLWWLLGMFVLLGAAFLADLLVSFELPVSATLVVMGIVLFTGASSKKIRWGSPEARRAMAILHDDEVRKLAQAKAFQNGFFVQMLYPIPCGYLLTHFGIANPWPFVAGSSAWLGIVTFLGTLLWYDRDAGSDD